MYSEMRKNAREWVRKRFSREEFNTGFIELLEKCLN